MIVLGIAVAAFLTAGTDARRRLPRIASNVSAPAAESASPEEDVARAAESASPEEDVARAAESASPEDAARAAESASLAEVVAWVAESASPEDAVRVRALACREVHSYCQLLSVMVDRNYLTIPS